LNSSAQGQQPSNASRPPPGDGGYSGEVRLAWIEFLNTLPPAARILDMSIGNHVPALIAAELAAAPGRDWRIDAIDPAGAEADRQSKHGHPLAERIVFHAGATFARLPFEDASFDAVCGHHAIEFTDTGKALAEVHRVLKPGGDAQFTLHHADSPLLRAARLSQREADLIFAQTKAFRRLHKLVTMSQIIPDTTERATNDVRNAIRTLKRGLRSRSSRAAAGC
jgi:ubiquinone/menaquinone biosynthesis C-methylase UbiE